MSIGANLKDCLAAKRALVASRLRQELETSRPIPLSFAQQRLWFLDQLEPNSPLYNVASLVQLRGALDLNAFEHSLNSVLTRHEALRTRFVCTGEMPQQVIDRQANIELRLIDLTHRPAGQVEGEAERLIAQEVNRPFQLSSDRLIRATLLRHSPEEHQLILVLHHIVADEWSLKVLFKELEVFYGAFVNREPALLPALPIQYADYTLWQRESLRGQTLDEHLRYWRAQLENGPLITTLPTDHPRGTTPTFRGATVGRALSSELLARLDALGKERGATLFMVLLAGFNALLQRYTQQEDIIVGSPVAGRNRLETEGLIGFFVNTLPLRTSLAGDPTFIDLLARVREATIGAYAHQDLPFDRLVEELHPERSLSQIPFTNVMFVLQSEAMETLTWPGLQLRFVETTNRLAKFDLTVVIKAGAGVFKLAIEYSRDLFEPPTMERLLGHFENILQGVANDPLQRISALPLLNAAERHQLLVEWNDVNTSYPRDLCVHQLFEQQAARKPDATAVVYGQNAISYRELNARANQLAHYLEHHQVGPGVPVCVCIEPCVDLVVSILAVLKAGGTYVPLDVAYPLERLSFMVSDSRAPVLLTRGQPFAGVTSLRVTVVSLDQHWEIISRESRANLPTTIDAQSGAYIMYTSGSTGEPKGVVVPHRGINRLVLNTNYINFGPTDRVAQVSNVSFDAATFELWGALLNGATLVGISREVILSPKLFKKELKRQRVTVMFLTAALFNQMAAEVPDAFTGFRTLMVGGEALDPKWIRAVLQYGPPQRLLNGYGPTENTTFTCWHLIREVGKEATQIPIGRPIANTQVYILDTNLNPVPIGVTGELYAAGDGLAHGYWHRPQLTAERFVRHAFDSPEPPRVLYRTGDLARFLPGGEIEFLGRRDDQVKIRGFRVELGEIESVLARHPAVKQCVVSVYRSTGGEKRLVAYVAMNPRCALDGSELRAFLTEKLPEYMVPAAFIAVASLPLTANGKVDRRSLPAVPEDRRVGEKCLVPPRDSMERELARIWESILEVRPIGVKDKFFDLGGHSLLAVRVNGQIEKTFGRKLRLATIFQAPTIEQLARILRDEAKEGAAPGTSSLVEIQTLGSRAPLFLVHGAGGGMFWGYVNLCRHLGSEQPVYGFKASGLEGERESERIGELAAHYIADLRAVQRHGPYYLGGYCFGGTVAYEMACQLREQGEEVALLALLNCSPPNSRYLQIPWTFIWVGRFLKNLRYLGSYFLQWTPQQRREFFRWKWALFRKRCKSLGRAQAAAASRVEAGDLVDLSSFTEEQRHTWEAHIKALLNFHPRPYSGDVHLFRSPGHPLWCSFAPDYGWGDLVRGRIEVTVVPGAHEKILQEPCVGVLARDLATALFAAQKSSLCRRSQPQPPVEEPKAKALGTGTAPSPTHSAVHPFSVLKGPRQDFNLGTTYPAAFLEVVAKKPSAIAVRFQGQELTYAELDARANQLAHHLQELGVGPEVLVGICLERSLELAVTLMAVFKAGGAYLPLDPGYPLERLCYMLEDSRAHLVVTRGHFLPALTANQAQLIDLSDEARIKQIGRYPVTPPANSTTPENLAYVIYTSGSTGRPKGVQITHRSMLNHNLAIAQAFELQPTDRALQFTPLSFDLSVEEIFPAWLSAATVVFRSEELVCSAKEFFEFVVTEGLTVLNLPTAYWHELVSAIAAGTSPWPSSVRLVVIGGERGSDAAYKHWKEHVPKSVPLINGYGVTETTVTTTLYRADAAHDSLAIGKPIANTEVVLLDERLRPVPPGVEGQLYVGGPGVARGYLNRPELTSERFVQNPLPDVIESPRLYKTGDLARLRPDGNLEFLGRADEQVKVRGYRIELGEVEAALESNPAIKRAVVVAREDVPGRKRLVAYYLPATQPGPRVADLSAELRRCIPDYMVPAVFVPLETLPLTPGGKVDRRGLPIPGNGRPEFEHQLVLPRVPLEAALARIWADVLQVNPIGVHDNFFDLGGDSLVATQVLSRIREIVGADLLLKHLFANPTVARLTQHLVERSGSHPPQLPVSALGSAVRAPLSANQKQVWLLEQFYAPHAPFNLPVVLHLKGELNLGALEQALSRLAARHEALRAVFPSDGGEPVQYLCEPGDIVLRLVDLSGIPAEQRELQASQCLVLEAGRRYITFHPVLRPVLVRLSQTEHWLMLGLHELAVDGRSVRVLLTELASLYRALAGQERAQLPEAVIGYKEAISRMDCLAEAEEKKQVQYWLNQLRDAPSLLDLPLDHSRPARLTGAGERTRLLLPADVVARVERLGQAHGCDLFTTLLTGFACILHRYSRAEDLVIGTVLPESQAKNFAEVVANLENPVALRCDLAGDPAFGKLLSKVRVLIDEARANSTLPFARFVDQLPAERNGTLARIFRVMFVLEPEAPFEYTAGSLRMVRKEVHNRTAKLDLSLQLTPTAGGLAGWIEYSTLLFESDRMERMAAHFITLLAGAANAPETPISRLPLLGDAERTKLLVDWNRTDRDYPKSKTLVQLFEEQAARTPDAEALICDTQRLTYCELRNRAATVAQRLNQLGVGPEDLVGIFLERSPEMIAAMLGTLMAGAAYVPLDPAYPRERLNAIVGDAKLRVLVSRERLRGQLDPGDTRFLCVETLNATGAAAALSLPALQPSNLAYVIYTSGSTGKPKGVALEHRNAVAFVYWARATFSPEELAGVLASTSICFDLSVFEIFVPLSWGGKVILAANALALPSMPAAAEVTLINTVPSAMTELLRAKAVPRSVRVVNLAGEPLSSALVEKIYRETDVRKVYDLYGPTETTTYSTGGLRAAGAPATIGRPLANEQVYLFDSHLQPVPIGIPGELYIGGAGVARGYLNRPELTAERFVSHPLNANERLYRTGDLARWRSDGNLEFLGRIDHQVKIRGFRIELGEIESAVKAITAVKDAVVVAREDQPGDKRLVAYIVATPWSEPNVDYFRLTLASKLPAYMVPSAFVMLDRLPLTPNGKVDRKQLPVPGKSIQPRVQDAIPPRNAVEEQLTEIWTEVLHVEHAGIYDNFFDAGGHSLLAAQVVSRIREQFKVDMPLFALFSFPTIAGLAQGLANGQWSPEVTSAPPLTFVPRTGRHCVSFVQERLWFLDQLAPGGHAYHVPAAIRLTGELDVPALEQALQKVIERHEALRTVFEYAQGQLTQVVLPRLENQLTVHEHGVVSAETDAEARTRAWLKAEAQQPFALTRGPLIRASLLRLSPTEHVFLVVMHHTISDGWSLTIFFQELEKFYSAALAKLPVPQLPQLQVQYIDFAHWQRELLQGELLDRELSYWKAKLAGAPPTVDLPTDHKGAEQASLAATRRTVCLEAGLSQAMTEQSQQQSATPFMLLMSGLVLTLHKWTGQTDLVVGTVVAGRNRRQLENVIGCFMNFLPVRTRLGEAQTGQEVLSRVKTAVLEGQSHQDCPFEKIVEAVNPERRLNQNPLYNVGLLLQNFPAEPFRTEKLKATEMVVEMDAALLDLRFEVQQAGGSFSLACEYRTDLFEPATIEELLKSFVQILTHLVREPGSRLEQFRVTPALEVQARAARSHPERQHIAIASTFTAEPLAEPLQYWLRQLNITALVDFAPYNQVFQQLLDPNCLFAKNPAGLNLVLLRFEDWGGSTNAQGDSLSEAARNVERTLGDFVGALKTAASRGSSPWLVCICPPSPSVLAKPGWQELHTRLEEELVRELNPVTGVHSLTASELVRWYSVSNYSDPAAEELAHVPYTPLFFSALATGIARKFHALNRTGHKVIVLDCDQTLWSGVCGEDGPGGVCLDGPRRALQEFMRAQRDAGMLLCLNSKNHEDDVRAVFAQRKEMPLQWDHFAGFQLNWQPKSENLKQLASQLQLGLDSFIFVDDNPLECAEVEANCPEVLTLLLPEPAVIPRFLDQCWAFDHLKVTSEDRKRAELYRQNQKREEIRSQSISMAEFLERLELQVQIEPLMPEHLPRVSQLTQRTNQFNCTAKKLSEAELQAQLGKSEALTVHVRDRFGDYGLVGALMYRRMERVLVVDSFLLSCRALGRGVEHRMLARAGAIAREGGADWVDVHFVNTSRNKPALDFLNSVGARFRQALNGGYVFRFPVGFAAEVAFHPVEGKETSAPSSPGEQTQETQKRPTPTVKRFSGYRGIALRTLDLQTLHQEIEAGGRLQVGRQEDYVAPRTDLERQLCELWEQVLRTERVGVQDDFFELGGHSLLAVRLFAEIERGLGCKLPLVTLFQAPTIEQLAPLLHREKGSSAASLLVPIQPRGSKPPLFLVHGAGGDILWGYANLAAHLPADQPVYGIKSRGQAGLEEFSSLSDMARAYVEVVRSLQPHGPYLLGGYCFGGNVAYEMAREFQARDEGVGLVALLDSAPSNAGYERVTWWRPDFAWRFSRNFYEWYKDFAALEPGDQRAFVERKLRFLARKFKRRLTGRNGTPIVDLEEVIDLRHFPENELKLWQIHLQGLIEHVQQPYSGPVTLLRTHGQPLFCSLEEDFCWGKLARGGVAVKYVPGSHEKIFVEPHVRALAAELAAALQAAQQRAVDQPSPDWHDVVTTQT